MPAVPRVLQAAGILGLTDRRRFLVRSAQTAVVLLGGRLLGESGTFSTFYVSTAGSNSSDGLSPATAWQDLTPVNTIALKPGNTIRFRGGDTFTGLIFLDGSAIPLGTTAISFSSYGRGQATLTNPDNCALYAYNPLCGIRITGLRFVGPGSVTAKTAGVSLYRDRPGLSRNIRITGCTATGWTDGISIGGWSGGGFTDIRVKNTTMRDNRDTGLRVFGEEFHSISPAYSNTDVYVGYCRAFDQTGNPTSARNSGSGIVLGSVDGGVVEHCTAYGNGALCAASEGPVGIWAYDSNQITLQSNVSYLNKTGGSADGGGFDLDNNCSNSVVQYNLAFGNAGAGVLLYSSKDNTVHTGNVVRYNLLWGNATSSRSSGEVLIRGAVHDASIYNNTMIGGQGGTLKSAALSIGDGASGIRVSNNIMLAAGTGPVVNATSALSTADVLFQGNSYHSFGAFAIAWGGTRYTSVAAWTQAENQELVLGQPSATTGDPQLVDVTRSPTPTDATGLRLQTGSPLCAGGLALADPGSHDYFGTALTSPVSIGGHEGRESLLSERGDPTLRLGPPARWDAPTVRAIT